ncbi:MAG: TetR/AcrR family transcriptional regulator [Polyangiaceae bacterium]|nr:TetR/AcrR family transcriptional regulator [Polyangiaceae bacterium]
MEKEERRAEILRAARKVFATKGYHEAKVDDIAAAAQVAKGTVYLYFRDKRTIFSDLVDHLFTRVGAAILRVDTAGDVAAQIKHNIRAILSVLVDDADTMQILFAHASALDPAFTAKIRSFHDGLKHLLSDSLVEGQRLGIVATGDTRLYASLTMGALREVLIEQAERPSSRRSREQIVEDLYAFLARGYLRVPETHGPGAAPPEPGPSAPEAAAADARAGTGPASRPAPDARSAPGARRPGASPRRRR